MIKLITIKHFIVLFTITLLAACSASLPLPKDYSGDWKALNAGDKKINMIPLEQEYFFTALKIDTTLIALLQRWASDVNLNVELRCRNDYSIAEALFDVQNRSLTAALEEINYVYSNQDIDVALNKDKNTVIFSCGKYNKEAFLTDKTEIKVIDLSPVVLSKPIIPSVLPPNTNTSSVKNVSNDTSLISTNSSQKDKNGSLKLNVSDSINSIKK